MSHIYVRKLIDDGGHYAGRSWYYNFRTIPKYCKEDNVTKVCQQMQQIIVPIAKEWNNDKNSEWISRIYFAAKMILSSSVMAQSLEFAGDKNLRSVTSYLDYYTVLNSLRAILLTNPNVEWRHGTLLETTHTKIINVSVDILRYFDNETAHKAKKHITHLKAFRELISYRAPSSGDAFPKPEIDIIELCRVFAEVAQMQSELFETSILKHAQGKYSLLQDSIDRICKNEIDGFNFFDWEDYYRMDYLRRKYPFPTNIKHVMSEGHVEDFFGSWCSSKNIEGLFNPDENWSILFDVP